MFEAPGSRGRLRKQPFWRRAGQPWASGGRMEGGMGGVRGFKRIVGH